MASDLHRTATTIYLCYVPILEDSTGAGRVGLAVANIQSFCIFARANAIFVGFSIKIQKKISMKKYKLLSVILLGVAMVGCDHSKKNEEKYFSFDESRFKDHYVVGEKVSVAILNAQNKKIDSIVYYLNDQNVTSKKGTESISFDLNGKKLGYQNLKALIYFDGETTGEEVTGRVEVVSAVQPKLLNYTVVNTYPHDPKAFTEGLEFYRDTLIESTGQKGTSYFRKLNHKTGQVYKQVDLQPQFFGEGITVVNGKIFQLTWQDNTGFIYDANTLKLEKTFNYSKAIEGWGMTNDGKTIYESDGTEKIWLMDPATQKIGDYINVYSGSNKIKAINELEWINGKIYGNIWQKDAIAVIDPATGSVEAVLNLADLRKKVTSANAEVLNGIAYNPKTKTIFVTGKYWDKMFEIKVTD